MTTLEKLAERVRGEAGKANDDYGLMPCIACDGFPCESGGCVAIGKSCPDLSAPDGSLMLARWAVKLVAEGLTPQIDEWERHIKGAQDGLTESDLLMNVAYKLLDLITEVEASAGEKSLKEGDANG